MSNILVDNVVPADWFWWVHLSYVRCSSISYPMIVNNLRSSFWRVTIWPIKKAGAKHGERMEWLGLTGRLGQRRSSSVVAVINQIQSTYERNVS